MDLQSDMERRKNMYMRQVAMVVDDPNTPDNVKIMFQNVMGALYCQRGIEAITLTSNQTQTLSPFAFTEDKKK
jgi:hypothetical protein